MGIRCLAFTGLADDVEHAAEGGAANRNGDGAALVDGFHAADHAFGGFHSDAADAAFAEVLLDLKDDVDGRGDSEAVADDAQRLVDRGHGRLFELHVHRGTRNLNYFADVFCHVLLFSPYRAAAPLTISIISLVIAA
jgi:hypothetical protein